MTKIAVIGAGIFGCTSAIALSKVGHDVDMYDPKGIMKAASYCNQYRVHRGYHYPRSNETVEYVKECNESFQREYGNAVVGWGNRHFYGISTSGSLTTPDQYESFMETNGLEYEKVPTNTTECLIPQTISALYEVKEKSFDVGTLYLSVVNKLGMSGVNFYTEPYPDHAEYDIVVNATYSNLNAFIPPNQQFDLQFELCEKPVVQLPERFRKKSMVVLDGNFCCIDPYGQQHQVIGHVEHAIHSRQIGKKFIVPEGYKEVLDIGRIREFSKSNRTEIMGGIQEYFNLTEEEVNDSWKGSMFTVRTVLPSHESDDARPTNLIKHSNELYSIFSGKISTCVDVANKLVKMI